jgi:sulfur-oxidizing protein SoxY
MDRRSVLKVAGAVSAAATALVAMPRLAMAAYTEKAFKAKGGADALQNAFGMNATTPSDMVKVKFPPIAENGAVVPVEVWTDDGLEAESIAILVEQNPSPLAIVAAIPAGTKGMVKTRCRMGKTTNVTAVVKSGGKLYTKTQEVKVTIGGCGG